VQGVGKWIAGGLAAVVGILGLFLAAQSGEPTLYWVGLGLFVFMFFYIMNMVRRSFDGDDD
jgi:hypothetical protein